MNQLLLAINLVFVLNGVPVETGVTAESMEDCKPFVQFRTKEQKPAYCENTAQEAYRKAAKDHFKLESWLALWD